MRVIYWGTYDQHRPRNRINIKGLRAKGIHVIECHIDAWEGVQDKSQIRGKAAWTKVALRLIRSFAVLIYRYMRQPSHDLVIVGYLGLIDLYLVWPFARLRGKPVVWDALMSLYNTLVVDRRLFKPESLPARALFRAEWLACRLADRVLVTTAHRRADFARRYGQPLDKIIDIPLGAELAAFPPREPRDIGLTPAKSVRVLFYGNFTPLHGVPIIVRAAQLAPPEIYQWTLIGGGQSADDVRSLLDEGPEINLEWVDWVDYEELHRWIHDCDIGLGIFGGSPKAAETVPNKIYQILATRTPLVTRDSPALRELIPEDEVAGIYRVPPEEPAAILDALERFRSEQPRLARMQLHEQVLRRIRSTVSGELIANVLKEVRKS